MYKKHFNKNIMYKYLGTFISIGSLKINKNTFITSNTAGFE